MIGVKGKKYDVTIYWPRKLARLKKICVSHTCPSFNIPRQARPRAFVSLVDVKGHLLLSFRLKKIETPRLVVGANGKRAKKGCELIAERGTMRKRWKTTSDRLYPVNRNSVGAFHYFNQRSHESVIFDPIGNGEKGSLGESRQYQMQFWPFLSNNIGRELSKPEGDLIKRYRSWINDTVGRFGHNYLKGPGLYTDLFIRSNWTLVEAKSRIDTWKIREAIGQLMDYRRFYSRSPRLAVLLPHRPSNTMLDLLDSCRITCIWENSRKWFSDSDDGALTRDLRAK